MGAVAVSQLQAPVRRRRTGAPAVTSARRSSVGSPTAWTGVTNLALAPENPHWPPSAREVIDEHRLTVVNQALASTTEGRRWPAPS